MFPPRGRRVALLSAGLAIATGIGGVAFGESAHHSSRDGGDLAAVHWSISGRGGSVAHHTSRDSRNGDDGATHWSYSDSGGDAPAVHWSFSGPTGDVIQSRSDKCPDSHPHRVGTYQHTTMRDVDGKVSSRDVQGAVCST